MRATIARVCAWSLAWSVPALALEASPTQGIGPGLGSMNVSPLHGESGSRPRTTAAQRAAAKRTAARIAKLGIVRRRLDAAGRLARKASETDDPFGQRRLFRAAVRRTASARRTLASLRQRWRKDLSFCHHADRLQTRLTSEEARFERLLKQAEVKVAAAVRAMRAARKR